MRPLNGAVLAAGKPFAVAIEPRRHRPAVERHQVGGGGADIDEQTVGHDQANQRGARVPIGRSDLTGTLHRADAIEKARLAAVEQSLAVRGAAHHIDQIGDAFGPAGKHV